MSKFLQTLKVNTMARFFVMVVVFVYSSFTSASSLDYFSDQPAFSEKSMQAAIAETHKVGIAVDDEGFVTTINGSVLFAVNKTNVDPNATFVKELRGPILQRIQQQQLELFRIEVRGAASPEGSTSNNARLAKARAQAIADTIAAILPNAGSDLLQTNIVTEDYEYLVQLMKDAQDPDAAFVDSIYTKWAKNPTELKRSLYAARKHSLWNRLLKEYFPQLRAARVKLYFREKKSTVTPKETKEYSLPTTPKSESNTKPNAPTTHKPKAPCKCTGDTICYCQKSDHGCCDGKHNAQHSHDGHKDSKKNIEEYGSTKNVSFATDKDGNVTSIEGHVIFAVNKTNITKDAPFIDDLRGPIKKMMEDQYLELTSIDVRGAASPEGSTTNNERLAKTRTQVLVDTITSILPTVNDKMVRTTSVVEDYEYLIHLMKAANDPDATFVDELFTRCKGNQREMKRSLYAARNHSLWNRLLKEYYPQLRATRVKLNFRVSPNAPKEELGCHCPIPKDACRCTSDPTTICSGKGKNPCRCMTDSTTCRCAINDSLGCHCLRPTVPIAKPAKPDTVEIKTIIEHRRPVWALSTNLIYDAWYMPGYGMAPMWNGKLEFYPRRGHFTYAACFINPYWHNWNAHKFYQIRNYELEARWYRRHDKESGQRWGWYLGAAVDANKFGIGLSDTRGWQGEGVGAQLTGGYVIPLNKCKSWKLEVNLGAGFYQTKYDPYVYEDPFLNSDGGHGEYDPSTFNPSESDRLHYYYKWYGPAKEFKKRQYRYRWFGPTQIGLSIKYDILWKRKGRFGVSFRHHEPERQEGGDNE